jgi:hypothetical protein
MSERISSRRSGWTENLTLAQYGWSKPWVATSHERRIADLKFIMLDSVKKIIVVVV